MAAASRPTPAFAASPARSTSAATGGGLFKTENCGESWNPISDGQISTGSIGSIDVSEADPNIVYVGTGSAAIRSNVIIGRGAYKSTDAGRTWQFIGLKDAGQIGSMVIHPKDPQTVWAAALGSPFGPNEDRGVYKTTDGGKSWKKTLFVNNETGARVVAVNLSNPNEVYAGMYRGFRKGWDIISGGSSKEGGIYKSMDGGETWKKLEAGLPAPLIGKIDIDIARSQPNIVYAMVEAPGDQGGLYRSDDSGGTWRLVNNAANIRARPFYFHYVDVNPEEPRRHLGRRGRPVSSRPTAASSSPASSTTHARQSRHLVQPRRSAHGHPGQRRRRRRHARRRPHVVEHPQSADRRVLHGQRWTSSIPTWFTVRSRTTRRSSCRACRPCRSDSIIPRRRGRRRPAARPAACGRHPTAR